MGPDTTPAAIVCGGETNESVVGDHERKARQLSVSVAPERTPAHHVPCAAAPQAPIPGSNGVSVPESRIAAASLSSTAAVWCVKSFGASASEFFGAQAKPKRSVARPARAP